MRALSTFLIVALWASLCAAAPEFPSATPAARGTEQELQTLDQEIQKAAEKGRPLLFVGDSITKGFRYDKGTWRRYYGHRNAVNWGIGGDRTQNVLYRLGRVKAGSVSPAAVVLLIGTNNSAMSADELEAGVRAVVVKVREVFPESKLLLLAIFPRGKSPDDERTAKIRKVNHSIAGLDDGKVIFFLDLTGHFTYEEGGGFKGLREDNLHLTPEGYRIWAEGMEPLLSRILGDRPVAPPDR